MVKENINNIISKKKTNRSSRRKHSKKKSRKTSKRRSRKKSRKTIKKKSSKKKVINNKLLRKLKSLRKKGRKKRIYRVKYKKKQRGGMFQQGSKAGQEIRQSRRAVADMLKSDAYLTTLSEVIHKHTKHTKHLPGDLIVASEDYQSKIGDPLDNWTHNDIEQSRIYWNHKIEIDYRLGKLWSDPRAGHWRDDDDTAAAYVAAESDEEDSDVSWIDAKVEDEDSIGSDLTALDNTIYNIFNTNCVSHTDPYYNNIINGNIKNVTKFMNEYYALIHIVHGREINFKFKRGEYRYLKGLLLAELASTGDAKATAAIKHAIAVAHTKALSMPHPNKKFKGGPNKKFKGGALDSYINSIESRFATAKPFEPPPLKNSPSVDLAGLHYALIQLLEGVLEPKHDFGPGGRNTYIITRPHAKSFKAKIGNLCGASFKKRIKKFFDKLNKSAPAADMYLFDKKFMGGPSSWRDPLPAVPTVGGIWNPNKYNSTYKTILKIISNKKWDEGRIFTDILTELNKINTTHPTYDFKYYNVADYLKTWGPEVLEDVKDISIDEKCQTTLFRSLGVYNLLYPSPPTISRIGQFTAAAAATAATGAPTTAVKYAKVSAAAGHTWPWKLNTLGNALDPGSGTIAAVAAGAPLLYDISTRLYRENTLKYCFWKKHASVLGLFYKPRAAAAPPVFCGAYTKGLSVNVIYYIIGELDTWIIAMSQQQVWGPSTALYTHASAAPGIRPTLPVDCEGIYILFSYIYQDYYLRSNQDDIFEELCISILLDFKKAGDWSQVLCVNKNNMAPHGLYNDVQRSYFTGDDKLAVLFAHLSYTPYICRWTDYTNGETYLLIVTPLYMIPDNKEMKRLSDEYDHTDAKFTKVKFEIVSKYVNDGYIAYFISQINKIKPLANAAATAFAAAFQGSPAVAAVNAQNIYNFSLSVNILIHYYKYREELELYYNNFKSAGHPNKTKNIKLFEKIETALQDISYSSTPTRGSVKTVLLLVPKLIVSLQKRTKFNKLYHLITTDYETYKDLLKNLLLLLPRAVGGTALTILLDTEWVKHVLANKTKVPVLPPEPLISFSKIIIQTKTHLSDAVSRLVRAPLLGQRVRKSRVGIMLEALIETLPNLVTA